MLRDQSDISADSRIVLELAPGGLDMDSVHRYRMRFSNLKPTHVWNTLDDLEFLLKAGALKRERTTNGIHPTLADRLGIGMDTVKQYLRKLREKGYVERVGGNTSAGRWRLLK